MAMQAKLIFLCGKMAAGKSTLARELAARERGVLIVQDELLDALFPGEIGDIPDYARCSARLRAAIGPHVRELLRHGLPVVLDFPGNTKLQRAWFRELLEDTGAVHELHWIDAPDALCKRQLQQRSAGLAAGTPWTTEAEFDAITAHFDPPAPDEGWRVVRHERA